MKKKAKTQKTKTTAASAKASKGSTTTKPTRGAKPKARDATSGKAARSAATAPSKQPKRGARKADTTTTKPAAATTQPEAPAQPATAIAAEEVPSPTAPSTTNEVGPATADSAKGAPAKERHSASDSRLPPVGTVLQKRDRHGAVRCECEVAAEGIRYQGELYRSLSAAAVAAARDLGLASKAINGVTWWGLSKPARPAADPLAALERAWSTYASRVESVLKGAKATEEGREPVLSALQRHARVLKNLHDEVA